jgi:hypothetical protein
MAIVQALLALIFRSAGKLLNTAFGWATVMLFGKVPQDRQIYLSIIAFGSVAWIVAVLGIIFPSFATFLLAFVPLPAWVDRDWVRLAMLAAAIIIPLIVGVISTRMLAPEQRPKGAAANIVATLTGYPYTVALALTLILMTALAPIIKIRTMLKRWSTRHIPVIVESPQYLEVVSQIERALDRGGFEVERRPASWMMRLPTRVLTALAGGAVDDLVADQLTELHSDRIEVLLHPSDLVVNGSEKHAARAHAIIAEQLAFSPAYMTWTKEANELEDRLRKIWITLRQQSERPGMLNRLTNRLVAVEHDLRAIELTYEEWDVLFREKLMVERALLQVKADLVDRPRDLTEASPEQIGANAVKRDDAAERAWWRSLFGSDDDESSTGSGRESSTGSGAGGPSDD